MARSLPSFGVLVLCLLPFTAACNDSDESVAATGPAPVAAAAALGIAFGAEPLAVRPRVFNGSCGTLPSFDVRLGLTMRGDRDTIVRGVRFFYTDRSGNEALPQVMPVPSLDAPVSPGGQLPSSSPVTIPGVAALPTTTSIPIPGATPVTGMFVSAGSHHRLDYLLNFSCVVVAEGQIVIVVDTGGTQGPPESTRVMVKVEN